MAKAKDTLRRLGKQPTIGRLVAELSFGFWVYLFDSEYGYAAPGNERLWPRLLNRVFPHMPAAKPRERRAIHSRLMGMLVLRNRAFHHEPLWRDPELLERHRKLIETLAWMSEHAATTVKEFDRFDAVYRAGTARYLASRLDALA